MILLLLPILILLVTPSTSNVIHWVSEPLLPGEAALIAVVSINRSLPLQIFGRPSGDASLPFLPLPTQGETKHGITATIPPTYAVGEFELQARRGRAIGPSYRVNVPRPWFVFGDQGNTATPGGHIRVVGDGISLPSRLSFPSYDRTMKKLHQHYHDIAIDVHSLAPPPIPHLFLTGAVTKHTVQLAGTNLTRSHATFALPHDVPMDEYTVEIANAMTGTRAPLCTFLTPNTPCMSTINITTPIALPASTKKFIVQAQQPGYGRNATAAIQQALSEAEEYGKGGIVYLPRGQYFMQGPILIPEGCILQGERRDLVSIYFFEQNQTTAPDAYVTGRTNTTQSFGVEDLTIYVTSYANNIIRFQPSTNGGHVKRIRMRFNSYFALEPVMGQASRGRNTSWSHGQGTAVLLAGKNIQIVDNDIYSSGDVVSTLHNGMAGGSYFYIARNRFWNGGTTHWGIEWKQCIYESNEATGTSITAMGSNYPQYNHNDGNPHVQNIYHFNNSQNMVWGNDREMMTSDAGGGLNFFVLSLLLLPVSIHSFDNFFDFPPATFAVCCFQVVCILAVLLPTLKPHQPPTALICHNKPTGPNRVAPCACCRARAPGNAVEWWFLEKTLPTTHWGGRSIDPFQCLWTKRPGLRSCRFREGLPSTAIRTPTVDPCSFIPRPSAAKRWKTCLNAQEV